MTFDIQKIRTDFPILSKKVYGKQLIYLDNGATTQKPQKVIDRISRIYSQTNSNIHRGVHFLSEKTTSDYENARNTVKKFINAKSEKEIIFTKGTTDAINLVAFSLGEYCVNEGDEIIVSQSEHHSNIVPWQLLCERKKAKLKVIPINEKGELIIEEYKKLLNEKTKIVSVAHVSNSLGIVHDIKTVTDEAHKYNAYVLIDAAQSVQHIKTDVQKLDCDFYTFSGHKIYAETGIGVLYGKEKILEKMPPYQGGGDMIKSVSFEKTTYAELPLKFEAGTSNYVGAISIATAMDYITEIGLENIAKYEAELLEYATQKLSSVNGLKIYGTSKNKAGAISFLLNDIHPYDAGMILDKLGIAIRTGTHCAEPTMKFFSIQGTARASFAFYNTKEEIDTLYKGLLRVQKMFGK